MVYYASKKLDENAMHYEHRQQAPRGCGAIRLSGRVLLLWLLETDERPSVTREGETRLFGWLSAVDWRRVVLPSRSAKRLVSQHRYFCPLSACDLGRKECTNDGSIAASRHALHEEGLPTRRLGWQVERCTPDVK